MLEYIIIAIYAFACLTALLYPKIAVLWFWPLVICHPSWMLLGLLPMNAGFDDLFLACLFTGSLIYSGGRLQNAKPVVFAVLFCVIAVFGDLSTIALGTDLGTDWSVKLWLKNSGLMLFVFAVCATTTDLKDIRKLTYSFIIGTTIAGIFIIFYSVSPGSYNPFQAPYWARGIEEWEYRDIGPFAMADEAGGMLGFAVLLCYFLIRFDKGKFNKTIIIVISTFLLIGLLLTGSRSGWIFVLFPVMLSSLLSKQKILGFFLLMLIAIAIFISVSKFEFFSKRVEQTVTQFSGGSFSSATAGRTDIWIEMLSKPKISWLLFGEGFGVMQGVHTHSNFIAMLKNTGLIGIVFWFILYWNILKKAFWLMKNDPDTRMSALFTAVFWAYIGYFAFFLPSTPMMWPGVRFADFFLMALIFLRYRQVEIEAEYAFEEDLYQTESELNQITNAG